MKVSIRKKHKHNLDALESYITVENKLFCLRQIFIIQRVKAWAIPCPHQLPTRGDNTVSVAQGGTATPGATKQLLPPDRVFKRIIYTYTPDQLRAEITLDDLFSVLFVIFLKTRLLSAVDIITRLL